MIKVFLIATGYSDNFNHVFGGSPMEYLSLKTAFDREKDYIFEVMPQSKFDFEVVKRKREEGYIIHCESWTCLCKLYKENFIPDVLGPTIQSPFKNEQRLQSLKDINFPIDNYFLSTVIRNNSAEERSYPEMAKKIKYIHLGVDTDKLKPSNNEKKLILWAGDSSRSCKNFELMKEIMKITKLPKPYEFKILSQYNVLDYWNILNQTKIVINTSKWESFCFAMFEAESKGVPVIYKKGLHGNVHKDNHIQVENTPEAYRDKILELLNNEELYKKESKYARDYTIKNSSYEMMVKTFGDIYKGIKK